MKTSFVLPIVVLSLLGILDAGYLTYNKINNIIPPCSSGFQCETVLNSPWANIGPIPLSVFGLFFYAFLFLMASLTLLEKNVHIGKLKNEDILLLASTFGGLFSLYLIFIMGVLIKGWCFYCLVSAGVCASIFLLNVIHYFFVRQKKSFVLKNRIIATGYQIIKNVMFLFDAEFVHNRMTKTGKYLGQHNFLRKLTRFLFDFKDKNLVKKIDGITFRNPIGLAAGFDYNADLTQILPEVGFGFQMVGSITYLPYEGNQKPRLGRFPNSKALLVNKGLKNIGAQAIIDKLTGITFAYPVGVSIAATNKIFDSTKEQLLDIVNSFRLFEQSQVKHSFYEMNISCPNTFGGEPFTNPKRLKMLLDVLAKIKFSKPVYLKVPIDQSVKETMALIKVAAHYSFVKGINIGNLAKDRNNKYVTDEDKKKWKTVSGNLSGKPTYKKSNLLLKEAKKEFKDRFTLIATGGVFTPEDAKEKFALGADLVQMITGMIFEGPQVVGMINHELVKSKKN